MIKWEPGKDSAGRIPLIEGKPAYWRSKCGQYTRATVYTKNETNDGYSWRSELWFICDGVSTNLAMRVGSQDAVDRAEEHANGLVGKTR